MEFADRRTAGQMLAAQLLPLTDEHPVVVALPRGGVPVAVEVARALAAPLDVLAVRTLGAPGNLELAVGAIAEDGSAVLDVDTARLSGMSQELLEATFAREVRELHRRVARYRDDRAPIDVRGRIVIVVDDGLATGLTELAAIRALRAGGAGRIVVAVPVGAGDAVALVAEETDEVVCLDVPHDFLGVGRWYRDFSAVSDDEVVALLGAAGPRTAPLDQVRASTRLEATRELRLDLDGVTLTGDLTLPAHSRGLVIFAHGSASSRLSPRNRGVARALNDARFATLVFDLLTEAEEHRRDLVYDIPLLASRLELVTSWALQDVETRDLPIGCFGASTGAAAALRVAADAGNVVRAVVSRGGRPDLAASRLGDVVAPTLLIVGSRDPEVLELNRRAAPLLGCAHKLVVVDGASHLFVEPGTLETVARLAVDWFAGHLVPVPQRLAEAMS
ncbi:MAG: phosphoribosyltransferase family protein [Solirubrobacteraceae bacterium]